MPQIFPLSASRQILEGQIPGPLLSVFAYAVPSALLPIFLVKLTSTSRLK